MVVRLLNGSGAVIGQVTTDATGHYQFSGLAAGTYQLEFVAPVGYTFSTPNNGNDNDDSDADPFTGRTSLFSLGLNEQLTNWDAGLQWGGMVATTP